MDTPLIITYSNSHYPFTHKDQRFSLRNASELCLDEDVKIIHVAVHPEIQAVIDMIKRRIESQKSG